MNRMVLTWLLLIPGLVAAQSSGLDPGTLRRPLADSWPSYSGDLTGRRYSTLKQINKSNVRNLSLSWVARGLTQGRGATGRGASLAGGAVGRGGGGGRGGSYPLTVSGEAPASTTPAVRPRSADQF